MQLRNSTQDLVRAFCQEKKIVDSLIFVEDIDSFYIFDHDKKYFTMLKPIELERKVCMYLVEHTSKSLSTHMIKDFIGLLKYFLYRKIESINFNYISLSDNKTLNVKTFEIVDSSINIPSFHYVNCSSLDITNYTGQPPERFAKFLDEVIVDKNLVPDKIMQSLIQEMIGYYLIGTLEAHVVFFLVGKGRNGKSVLLEVIREMVGEDFCAGMTVETMTADKFAVANLVGKKMNICAEDESTFVKTDKFKAMIAGDTITIRRIYGSHFEWRPTVTHLFSTNDMPAFSGLNKALIERVKIIPFNRYFNKEERDTGLVKKLTRELGGIIAWAIDGAKRLQANRFQFTSSVQSDQKSLEFQENISAAVLFYNENYKEDPLGFTANDDLYLNYTIWCEKRGKKKQSYYVFIKDIETLTGLSNIEGRDNDNCKAKGKAISRIIL